MPILRSLLLLLAGTLSLSANPFLEAERSFLQQLNSIPGIDLGGGPFHTSEHHHFDGESGYFVLAPAVPIPTLDQRLTIQTRKIDLVRKPFPTNAPPVATPPYSHDDAFGPSEREQILAALAQHGFASLRDEITAFDINSIQIRPVLHPPVITLRASTPSRTNPSPSGTNTTHRTAEVLLGAQSWLGMPLFRLSFDHRDDFNLGRLRSGPIARLGREMPRRLPFLTPQTFFAEPGLGRADWRKILNNLAAIEIPSAEIIEASLSDTSVTLSLDIERPSLPQQWVKLEKKDRRWTITQAVEFRAEFPRPAVWWSFLPLLPATDSSARNPFPNSKLPAGIRDSITSLVSRLRGVGEIVELDSTDRNQTILVHTSYLPTHSYKLLFTREQGNWRLFSVHYSNDR